MDNNKEEIRSTIEQIKAQLKAKPENKDKTDDEIDEIVLDGFLEALDKGEMEKDDLLGIMDLMGYEPTEEFAAALGEEQAEAPVPEAEEEAAPEEDEGADADADADYEGLSKEELEETRTIDKDSGEEGVEDFKEDVKDLQEGKHIEDEDEEEEEVDDEDEDAQRERASKLLGVDLRR